MEHEGARRDRLDGIPDEAVGRLRAVGCMVIAGARNARRIVGGKRYAITNAGSVAHMPAFAARQRSRIPMHSDLPILYHNRMRYLRRRSTGDQAGSFCMLYLLKTCYMVVYHIKISLHNRLFRKRTSISVHCFVHQRMGQSPFFQ